MRKTTITIKRPEGNIETLDVSDKFRHGLSAQMFAQIKTSTAAAGRGECLSFDVIDDEISDAELAAIAAHDKKCRWFVKHGFNDIN